MVGVGDSRDIDLFVKIFLVYYKREKYKLS